MSFMMMRKKRYKFQVNFCVDELSSVPYVNGIIFVKVRLLDGGSFTELSTREELSNHCVKWRSKFSFVCKMNAPQNTGVLESCYCRVSVRKELKGGKSYQKLGFVDVNLSEFAGAGVTSRRCLLEGYDSKHRQDNSILTVSINMTLLSGDPLFKVPENKQRKSRFYIPGEPIEELHEENKGDNSEDSVTSGSTGFGSLPRKNKLSTQSEPSEPDDSESHLAIGGELGHNRNASNGSQLSKVSGYSSIHTHSRQSSLTNHEHTGHLRSPSSGSENIGRSLERRRKGTEELNNRRAESTSTRVDADEIIDELIKETDFHIDESAETSGLQLYVAKDGTTALGSQDIKHRMTAGAFEQVVMDQR
ncbi:unnamed protein product [Owenia fusiformis]|uniref:C2 NT-type domain-containing protein n=1 Tax=Owenia fusiformis TaxID=6347 RepID=A0A8S4P0E4_OWEFU|nr:unnamed protein product [Owenia fusiformis]